MQLSIITINYKKPELTIACLHSLYTSCKEQFERSLFELIVVDNFSQDNSVTILEKEIKAKNYKNVHLVTHKENNGFGGGNNFGSAHAKGKTLLFLNNDTIVEKGLDTMLAFFLDNEKIGILGGILHDSAGYPQHSYDSFYTLFSVLSLLLGAQRLKKQNVIVAMQVDWVKGACMMIKKELFENLGGFDENIFMYTEDMELCYRVEKAKKEIWVFPDIDIRHKDQGSSNRAFAIVQIYAGILYFYKKHRSKLEYILVKLLLQSKAVLLISLGKLINNHYLVSTYEKALTVI